MDSLCTRAITGTDHPSHQTIFICETCQLYEVGDGDGEPLPSCICQSCAETCHDGHEVYYVGVGPCTCDCPSMVTKNSKDNNGHKCMLVEHSAREAQRLGFAKLRSLNDPIPLKVPPMLASMPGTDADLTSTDDNDDDDDNNDDKEEEENDINADGITEQISNLCVECHSSMGGYTYASYTLPILVENEGELCQNLIRQAEALTDCSNDTFWVPGDEEDETGVGWCDLEILARKIYKQHVQSYSLQTTATDDEEDNARTKPSVSSGGGGGAEWWVQVKPAGTSRAPVDLHYDKDEALAETFRLGSFPTLSTVTYLTGEDDNAPTVIFPHTYNDEENRPIETMLLSHAARAKHVVFDGRLLHGAPAHPALRRHHNINKQNEHESAGGDADEENSSLRVTFLVNIWKSGRPASVNILPESFRTQIRSVATTGEYSFRSAMALEFQQRHVSKLTVPARSSMSNGDVSKEDWIILPFVSHGATWIGDDEAVEVEAEDSDEEENVRDDGSRNTQDEADDDEEEEEEEEEEELVMVLSPFATPEYMHDKADTIVLSFEDGNAARLVREGMLDESTNQGCRWKKLVDASKSEKGREDTTAAKFLSDLNETVPFFVTSFVAELKNKLDMDVTKLEADHVCYRTDSMEQYTTLVEALQSTDTNDFTLLVESEIGGRPISTFKLATPIEFESEDSIRSIDVIEIPSPKEGSPYKAGLEHVEFAIGDGSHKSPMNDEAHQAALKAWMERYPSISWNTKAIGKECNPDVSYKLELDGYGNVSVKFHLIPLEDVIKFEAGV